ncbi:Nsmce2 [Phodopus roborovskii]|uniref:E3 SUMO-protein ligase NSE2 n=1 Tax=Phodopus roborovskii TaxID=109678 RepID=A0AAV0A0A2_PHORO|nr:Nsmce2 [Phodopus roborovskii]
MPVQPSSVSVGEGLISTTPEYVKFHACSGPLETITSKPTHRLSHGLNSVIQLTDFPPGLQSEFQDSQDYGMPADRENDWIEGVDEDMIVTQSQTNFICPITQLEMKKPVKNKVCGHTYEEDAIVRMIDSKHKRKKKACCPKIGCSHTDMRMSDLIPDEALRRAIENHKKKKRHPE